MKPSPTVSRKPWRNFSIDPDSVHHNLFTRVGLYQPLLILFTNLSQFLYSSTMNEIYEELHALTIQVNCWSQSVSHC